jgi:transglutaminase-like putative cysteine protease
MGGGGPMTTSPERPDTGPYPEPRPPLRPDHEPPEPDLAAPGPAPGLGSIGPDSAQGNGSVHGSGPDVGDPTPPRAPAGSPPKAAPGSDARPAPRPEAASAVRLTLALIAVAALAAAAGLGFRRVFALGDIGPVAGVAAVAPVLLSALVSWPRRRTWPLWISIVSTVAGWTLVAGLTLFHGDFAVIGGALRNSWKATLTTLMPAPGRPELLVLPHVLIWFAAVAGAEAVLRSRTKALPALPAVAVFGVALLLGVGGPGSNLPVAAALVGLTAVLVVVRGAGRAGRAPAGLAMAAAVALVAALAGPILPVAGTPYDPRASVEAPPPQQRDSISPLDRVSAWLQTPDQQMFTVHTTAPENWRLAVLDRFDGVTWTSGAKFVPAGNRVPVAEHAKGHAAGTRVDQRFTIQTLPGVWVPAADRPRTITGLGVTIDPVSGVLTSARQLRTGQAYSVISTARDYDADELAVAEPARDAEAQAATALPESPGTTAQNAQVPAFRKLAEQVTRDQSTGFQRAAKLADYLRTAAKYDVTGLPGHTYAQLDYFLTRSRRGTSEQFATAFAVLARSVGLPARVVVGFRPGVGGNGLFEVRSGDVLVWPEVDFAGLGWVPFYPTPEQEGRSQQSGSVPAGDTQQKLEAAQKNAASKNKGNGAGSGAKPPPPKPPAVKRPPHHTTPWWVYASAAAGLIPVAYLVAVLILPVLRRRRRRTGTTPADRITGAWEQTVETLHAVGLPTAASLTAHEVAGFGVRTVDGTERHLRPLADLVNRAEYAEAPPDPSAAEVAWRHTDQIGRLVSGAVGPMRRIGRRLHPRGLRAQR